MELVADIIDIIVINRYFKAFFDMKSLMSRNAFCMINILLAVGKFLIRKQSSYTLNFLYGISCIFIILLNYAGTAKKKCFISLMLMAGGAVSAACGIFLLALTGNAGIVLMGEEIMYLAAILISETLKILFVVFSVKKCYEITDCSEKIFRWIGGIFTAVILVCLSQIYFIDEYSEAAASGVELLFMAGIIVFAVFAIKDIADILKLENEQKAKIKDMEYKEEYYELLKRKQMELEKIRHNYKNQLLAIKGTLKKDRKMVEAEIDLLLGEIRDTGKGIYTPNHILNTICNHKFHLAEKMGIKVEYDIKVPADISIDARSLSVVYGNLFDNAVEACLGLPIGQRTISFYTFYKKKELYIRMENPYTDKQKIYLNKNQKHGIGLASVGEIVKKYDGIYDTDKASGRFRIRICMYSSP